MARSLWQAMGEVWPLPNIKALRNTGSEWLLHLLEGRPEVERVMILMTLWRIWHCRNEVVHQNPAPSIDCSKRFLQSYLVSLLGIKQFPCADAAKGKMVVFGEKEVGMKQEAETSKEVHIRPWRKPNEGTVKLNVDGSFCATSANGGTRAVLCDGTGSIIFPSCRFLQSCRSPLEAELEACRDGVVLTLLWSTQPCVVEMDCCEAVKLICSSEVDRSPFTGIVQEIKHLLASRGNLVVCSVSRQQNNVSHLLANLGRTSSRTKTWPGSGPADVTALCRKECNDAD
jgi:hypothetical protein